ncbi:MAG: porin PorA family protein [Trebonia sp.]
MNRLATALVLTGLAACCAAAAVTVGGHAAGRAADRPLGGQQTVTLTAAHASYLSPTTLKEVTDADIEVTDTITPAGGAGYPAVAIWDIHRSSYDTTSHQQLAPMSRTVAFDRTTAGLVNCCGGNINGDALIRQSGIAGWAFPVGTRKQTYDVFDPVLGQPEPATYSGTDTVDGILAYQFTEVIPATKAGFSPLSATDPKLYALRRRYWVDPETGMLLDVTENEDLSLVSPATGSVVTHLFRADLDATPATVAQLASQDARTRDEIARASDARLALFGVAVLLALLALLAGWPVVRGRGTGRQRRRPAARSPGGR